jgi:hypothetical protein
MAVRRALLGVVISLAAASACGCGDQGAPGGAGGNGTSGGSGSSGSGSSGSGTSGGNGSSGGSSSGSSGAGSSSSGGASGDSGTADDSGGLSDATAPIPPTDWPVLQGILSGIQGVATTPPAGVVTAKYTPGMLLGNGDLGVVVGDTTTSQKFYFAKNDFWGSAWFANHMALIPSVLTLGTLAISSSASGSNPGAAYKMTQDILDAQVATTMQFRSTLVTMQSWTADSDSVFVTELSAPAGAAAVTLDVTLAMPTTAINTAYPFTVGATQGVLWATRANNLAGATDYQARAGVAVALVGGPLANTSTSGGTAAGSFTLNGGESAQLVTVFRTDGRIGPSGPSAATLQSSAATRASAIAASDVAALKTEHQNWWKDFWLKSFVRLNDSVLESYYYGALYVIGSASREGHLVPGLWGPWATMDGPGWGGRYFINYNFEAPYYGVFSANRPELALPYTEEIFSEQPFEENLTAAAGYQGLAFQRIFPPFDQFVTPPAAVTVAATKNETALTTSPPDCWCPDDQKSNASFGAIPTIWYWEYTQDAAYLASKLYPHLKALDAFWRDYLVLDGARYVAQHSSAHEGSDDLNPNLDIGFIRKVENTLLAASTALGVDAQLRPVWQDVLAKLSAYPTGPYGGKTVFFMAENIAGSTSPSSLFTPGDQPINMEGCVFPGENIYVGGDASLLQIAHDTIAQMGAWGVTPGGNSNNGFCKEFVIAARAGWPADDLFAKLKAAIQYQWRASNLTVAQAGGGIETSGTIEAIDSMLMQSEGGVVRVFPVWPVTTDAYFKRLRAKGAFLVSSERKAGQVTGVQVTSEAGGTLSLQSPWASGTPAVQQIDGAGNVVASVSPMVAGGVISFATTAGQTYSVTNGP